MTRSTSPVTASYGKATASVAATVAPLGSSSESSRPEALTTWAGPRYSSARAAGARSVCFGAAAVAVAVVDIETFSSLLWPRGRHPAFGFEAIEIGAARGLGASAGPASAAIVEPVEVSAGAVGVGHVG